MAHPGHIWLARWTAGITFGALLALTPVTAQLGPIGDEFEVSTQTAGDSKTFPAISASADEFVIVWSNGNASNPSPDGDREGVAGQRYASDGSRIGSEFQINTYTTGAQRIPSVAASLAGDFVVVWRGIGTGGDGVQGQRYDSGGVKQGTEFLITTDAFDPRVARDDDGNFIVAWYGGNDGGPPAPVMWGVFARRYDSAGAPLANAFQVNTYTPNLQRNPAIAITTGGAFVVVWQSDQDGSNDGIYAQRYSSTGVAAGTEFIVNTYTPGFQSRPAVAADDAGNFVVAWQSSDQDGSSSGVFAQRFDSAGARLGSEFQINTYTPFDQSEVDVALGSDGRFVIAWGSTSQDEGGRGVFAQEFSSTGARIGSEFAVNVTTTGDQDIPVVAATGPDAFVIGWDSGASGVFARRFGPPTPTVPPSPTPTPTVEGGSCPGDCDGSQAVQVNELVRCVNISLETAAVSTCVACDDDGNGRVTIDELVKAVNSLLRSCPTR